jgi:tRNA A-37 threonylcarbamoyl transferase component Bud32
MDKVITPEALMTNKEDVRQLINQHKRLLNILREKEARLGLNAPPEITLEIEDIETKITHLQTTLRKLENDAESAETPAKPNGQARVQPSPFIDSGPVPPPYFIGRTQEVAQILSQFANPAHSCTAISGDPRVGKTSLLHYLLRMPQVRQEWGLTPNRFHFLYLDCHNIVPFSEGAFWRHVLRELEPYVSDHEILKTNLQDLLTQTNPDSFDLKSFFDKIARADRLIILMLDEFEWVVENLDSDIPTLLYNLRSLITRPERGLVLLIATRTPLEQLCSSFNFRGSPFPNCFIHIIIPPFHENVVDELFSQYQVELTSEERAYLNQVAGRLPYMVQLTALIITQSRNKFETETQHALIEANLEHKSGSYFQDLFNYSSKREQMILAFLALYPLGEYLPPTNHSKFKKPARLFERYERELISLKRRGLVLDQADGPILFSPIFTHWLLRKVIIDRGSEMLVEWEPLYKNYLSTSQKHNLKKLVDKLGRWPEIVKLPESLAEAYTLDEMQALTVSQGEYVLGRYVIEESIGGGGMADVFKARHLDLDRVVAIKRLRPALSDTTEFQSRFRQEAKVVAGLRHAHIVQVYDFGIESNHYYMVMEFIEGQDLKNRLQDLKLNRQTLSWDEALHIAGCVADALNYAHEQQIIHRDVKPANILLTDDGGVFLVDFGLVRLLGQTGLSEAGEIMGTLAYMAPEQLISQGREIDHRVDIYALGSVVYEMFTGRPPFEEADFPLGFLNADPLPPRSSVPELPELASQVILKALAKNPTERPASASQFVDEVHQALNK